MVDSPSQAARKLATVLGRDHERLRLLFTELVGGFEEGDRDELRHTFARFERGLLAHLSAEERHLFPLFDQVEPVEAAALKREHALFRKTLDEIGVGVDLHSVKLDVAQAFVDALSAHALREDQKLYRWAEQGLDLSGQGAVAHDLARDLSKDEE